MHPAKTIVLALTLLATNVYAADAPHPTNSIRADLSIPDSPVTEILGTSTKAIVPSTGRELGLGLIKSLDANGNLKDGVHFEFAPTTLFAMKPPATDHKDPNVLDSLKIGLATAKGSGYSDDGQRIAVGFHINLVDHGSPAADTKLTKCFYTKATMYLTTAETELLRIAAKDNPKSTARFKKFTANRGESNVIESDMLGILNSLDVLIPSFAKSPYADACRKESEAQNWNRTRVMVGAANSWNALDKEKSSYKSGKQGIWTTFAYGFEHFAKDALGQETDSKLARYAQFVLHGQYLRKDIVTDSTISAGKYERNHAIIGLGFRFGQPDINAIVVGRAERSNSAAKGKESARTLALQAEKRLMKDLWLNLSLEGKGVQSTSANKPFAFAGIKWGSSSGATLAP